MTDPIKTFLDLTSVAVVGASADRSKFGNIVFRDLREKGYDVYPVNPKAETIEGDVCYADLQSLSSRVEGAVIVVPPAVSLSVVQQAHAAGIGHVWMQPGAESADAVQFCEQNGINVVHQACVMIHAIAR